MRNGPGLHVKEIRLVNMLFLDVPEAHTFVGRPTAAGIIRCVACTRPLQFPVMIGGRPFGRVCASREAA